MPIGLSVLLFVSNVTAEQVFIARVFCFYMTSSPSHVKRWALLSHRQAQHRLLTH